MMKAACQALGRIIHLACRRMVGEGREAERERIGVLLGDRWNEIFLIWFWTLLGQAITFPLFLPSPLFLKSLPFPSLFLFPCFSHSLLLPNPLTNSHYTQTPSFATLLSGFAAQITPRFWSFVKIRPSSVKGWKSICKTGCACPETKAEQELYVHAVCFYGLISRLISMY